MERDGRSQTGYNRRSWKVMEHLAQSSLNSINTSPLVSTQFYGLFKTFIPLIQLSLCSIFSLTIS